MAEIFDYRRQGKFRNLKTKELDSAEKIGDQNDESIIKAKSSGSNMHDYFVSCVNTIREPIAEIQEKRGISRNQRFTFVDLMSALFNHSYNSCLCIMTMVMGLLPLLEGMLNLVRFILDKMLEIDECKCIAEKVCKLCVFIGEIFVIFVLVSLIVTIILLPVANLIQYSLLKIWRLAN